MSLGFVRIGHLQCSAFACAPGSAALAPARLSLVAAGGPGCSSTQGCTAALKPVPLGNNKSCFYPDPEVCLVPRFTVPLGGLPLLK